MCSPRARALLRRGRHRNVPRPTMGHQRNRHPARLRGCPTRGGKRPHHPHKILRGVLQPGDKAPARTLGQITSGRAGYHLGLAMLCLTQWIKRRWPSSATVLLIWAISTAHTQVKAGPDTRMDPPPPGHNTPSPAGTTPSTGSSAAWTLAHHYSTLFPPPTKRCTKYAGSSAQSLPKVDTYIDTTHANPTPHPPTLPPPLPLPPHSPPGGPHTPTIARNPGRRDTDLPRPPN